MLSNSSVLPIVCFFLLHWWGSVFMQTFFLHRYASHGMFRLSRGWERTFHFLTYALQGSSYLVPSAYAFLHRAHHAYSDTAKDPHTPHRFPNAAAMMWETKVSYMALVQHTAEPEPRFQGYVPSWPALERIANSNTSRIAWGTAYTLFYIAFAPSAVWFLLLPIHYLMGPIHGAIVNWAGHKYGYRNYGTRDKSRNVIPWDVVCMGELFQNNHHRHAQSINFGQRAWEWDPSHGIIRALALVGVLDITARPGYVDPEESQETTGESPLLVPEPVRAVAETTAAI
jgi:stearoyl-CoA desaturase (delta-9 desaturase)